MSAKAPRYDLPKAAPEPLRLVQRFVNTVNLESGDDWLSSWFEEEGVKPGARELDGAREVREALRELLYANNGQRIEADPVATLNRAAAAASLTIDFDRCELEPQAGGAVGAVGRVLAAAFLSVNEGSWPRLKACRNHHCRWAFYDESRNRSARWCSMQLCGNRTKTRAYRARHARA
jgi:predicted RNA-binding Zn ribbon-like protein